MENSRGNKRQRETNFIVQGSILAIAGILVRLIGMFYRIPLARIIGDEGNGYYSSAFSIYSILLILSSYSLPVAVSKMVALRVAKKEYKNSVRVLKVALLYAFLAGGAGAFIMWFGAEVLATQFLKMPFAMYALKTLAPTVWVMAFLGVLRGYFQGLGTMLPTAASQILEQIVNAAISIFFAYFLFQYGLNANQLYQQTEYSYAFGAAGGTIGTGVGALVALLFTLLLLLGYKEIIRKQSRGDRSRYCESYGQITYGLVITVIPIILSSTVYNISSILDNGIYASAMIGFGIEGSDIATAWGIYMGKYHLLFNIPVAIANSLSSSLIPSLAASMAQKNNKLLRERVSSVIRFSMMIAIPATVGLATLAGPINRFLFGVSENSMLETMTMTGSVAVLFFSLSTVTNGVLQGINRMKVPIRNAVISLCAHVVSLLFMLYVLKWGIYSVVIANILFAFFMCVLNAMAIKKYLRYHQEWKKTFILPFCASVFMGIVAFVGYRLIHLLTRSNAIGVLVSIILAAIVYGVLLIKLKCVEEDELYFMPGGRKVLALARKFQLL